MGLPALMEDLVQEILLRVPPDEPSDLIRAAVVCKAWRRILSDGGFRRRYCTFHRTRPLLGYISNYCFREGLESVFVPTTSFLLPPLAASRNSRYRALDCRHGRVLIDTSGGLHGRVPTNASGGPPGFIVWDPITGDLQHLSFPADSQENLCFYTGAVLCAVDGCDHLDCSSHGGPFLVVFVGETEGERAHAGCVWASVYSSETREWSAKTSGTNKQHYPVTNMEPSLLIGGALYFTNFEIIVQRILKYDLTRHELSVIDDDDIPQLSHKSVAVDIDGGLGLVEAYHNSISIYTWSQQDGIGRWLQVRHDTVVEPNTLIPQHGRSHYGDNPRDVVRFVEGTDTILFTLDNDIDLGIFTLDLKSGQVRKVTEIWDDDILPYTCFYTPGTYHHLCAISLTSEPCTCMTHACFFILDKFRPTYIRHTK
jgi:hypothetical protein